MQTHVSFHATSDIYVHRLNKVDHAVCCYSKWMRRSLAPRHNARASEPTWHIPSCEEPEARSFWACHYALRQPLRSSDRRQQRSRHFALSPRGFIATVLCLRSRASVSSQCSFGATTSRAVSLRARGVRFRSSSSMPVSAIRGPWSSPRFMPLANLAATRGSRTCLSCVHPRPSSLNQCRTCLRFHHHPSWHRPG